MKNYFWLLLCAVLSFSINARSQPTYTITGTVKDKTGQELIGAAVLVNPGQNGSTVTEDGKYSITSVQAGRYELVASYLGYEEFRRQITVSGNLRLDITLSATDHSLQEVEIVSHHTEIRKKEESLNIEIVDDEYLKQNLGGSLMKSLEKMPGVSSIDIGSGQSKPVIRGLGFNRVVVVENNIKHESQQWGADHGLEIDQFATQSIEVIKGPSSLQYGSDAIGGIIHINHNEVPLQNSIEGNVDIMAKSNNQLLGSSVSVAGRKNMVFAGLRATAMSYGDYRVPADTVVIFPNTASYPVGLPDGRMRNTAGYEHNYHGTLGFIKGKFQNRTIASFVNSKGGIFANAQGLEAKNADTVLHDKSTRDVQYPRHNVSHIKLTNTTRWRTGRFRFESNLGYQHNFRQEWSKYVGHGEMPAVFPDTLPFSADIEREFEKDYYSGTISVEYFASEKLSITPGVNAGYQKNAVGGRGFIIPAYQQLNLGGYLLAKYAISATSVARIGGRYDYGLIRTKRYSDWYPSKQISGTDTSFQYVLRAEELDQNYSQFSWGAGYNYTPSNWILKLNIGKSFRMPSPQELAANGVNYHYFRHEIGDRNVSPEMAWQFDVGAEYTGTRFSAGASPFVNYFTNYIYLNPTPRIEKGYQVFEYTESEVFRYGTEVHVHYDVITDLRLAAVGDYVYSLQVSGEKQGYTLPYSPPPSALFNATYTKKKLSVFEKAYLSADYRFTAAQSNIVPPEEKTPAYSLVNLGLGGRLMLKKQAIQIHMQVQNVFNTQYLNHTSFYRLMNVPEPGRNFIISISIPFSGRLKNTGKTN